MATEEKYDPNSMVAVEKYDPNTMVPAAAPPKEGNVLAKNSDGSIMAVPGSIADTLDWTGINTPNAQGGRGTWRHIADEANQATNKGFGGLIARTLMGNSNYANMPELATATGQIDNLYNHLNTVDPSWRDDDGKVQGFLKAAAGMLGSSLGAVNPLYAVGGVAGGAKGILPRVGQTLRSGAKVGGASALGDVITQGLNRTQGVDAGKPLDWQQALAAGMGGMLFGGGTDALGQLWSHYKSGGFRWPGSAGDAAPDPLLHTGDVTVPPHETRAGLTPEELATYENLTKHGTDDELRAFRDHLEQTGYVMPKEQLESFLAARAKGGAVTDPKVTVEGAPANPADEIVVSAPRQHPRGELTVEQFPRQDEFGNTFNDIRIRDPQTGKETHFGEHYDNGEIILRDSKTTKPIRMTPEDYDAIRSQYEPPKPIGTPEEAPATGPAPDALAAGPKEEPYNPDEHIAVSDAAPPSDTATEGNVTDLGAFKETKDLKAFHNKLMTAVRDRAITAQEAANKLHENGTLPWQKGDRFTTDKSRANGDPPWEVTGHAVDGKDPSKYGYRVKRTHGDGEEETGTLWVHDPKGDARLRSSNPDWNRADHVAGYQKLAGPGVADAGPAVVPQGKATVADAHQLQMDQFSKYADDPNVTLGQLDAGINYLDEAIKQFEATGNKERLAEATDLQDRLLGREQDIYTKLETGDKSTIHQPQEPANTNFNKPETPAKPAGTTVGQEARADAAKRDFVSREVAANYEGAPGPTTGTTPDNWTDRTGTPANDNGAGSDTPPPGGEPPVNIENVLNKLRSGMKTWRRMTRDQKELYRKQRGERLADAQRIAEDTGGREGFYQRLSALKGEMKKLQFQPQEDVFTPQEMYALFEHVTKSDRLDAWEQISAGRGLDKIMKGEMPQAEELAKLARVLDPETIKGLLSNRTLWQKVLAGAEQVVGLPKSFKSSMDLSAPFNQGVFLAGKKEWNQAFGPMIRDFADGKYHEASMEAIRRDPMHNLAGEAGLAMADEHSPLLSEHEDAFRARWAEKVPVVGTGIHMSERAYNGFLNRVRFDTFKMMVNKSVDLGLDVNAHPEAVKAIAHYVNVVTGRGSLGSFEAAAQTLSTVLFSPRLLSARIESVVNPMLYINLPKGARMEAMKDWIRFGSMITAATSLASFGLGAKVDTNPTSSDFMKIRIGNTRHDLFGGWQQLAVLASRIATNSRTSSHGETTKLGSNPTTPDFVGTVANFIRGKLSPAAGYVVDAREGKDITGQPFQVGKNTMDLFIPMLIDDLAKNIGMYGPAGGAAQSADALFGVRQQTYDENRSYTQSRFPNATVKDPLVDEIARLAAVNKGSITPGVEKTIRWSEEGERRSYTLTDDEYQQYKDLTEKYTKEDLSQLVKTPEWKTADDKTKIGWVREAAREQKNRAMDELFFNDHESAQPMSYEDYVNAQQ